MYFQYGEAETAYLSARDERMAAVIAQVVDGLSNFGFRLGLSF